MNPLILGMQTIMWHSHFLACQIITAQVKGLPAMNSSNSPELQGAQNDGDNKPDRILVRLMVTRKRHLRKKNKATTQGERRPAEGEQS